jgi:hypothetical protein
MAKKRKAAKARRGKAKTAKRRTVKRAAAVKPARKTARKTAKRRPKAKPVGIGARLEHAMAAVLDTLTDAERLHARVAARGVQELE